MPQSCLIGYSGFVGSNLLRQYAFTDVFRSTDIEQIRGRQFDLVVCAGASAAKWVANRRPDEDLANIDRLLANLAQVRASRAVLVSTVDVYPVTRDVDESSECAGYPNHAYGKNRLHLEAELGKLMPELRIVRLPGLFGPGLKKNVIYDLIHDNCLETINPDSVFQYYGVTRLWSDLQTILESGVSLINLATEPIATSQILASCFPEKKVGPGKGPAATYAIRSRHAGLFGGSNGYCFDSATILKLLTQFIQSERQVSAA